MGKRTRKRGSESKVATKGSPKRSTTARSSGRASSARRSARGGSKKLVIVESPAKARTINHYLGADYVVRASMGHVRDLPASNFGVDLDNDFAPTYQLLPGRKKVLDELSKLARTASEVYLATDLDREGEAIAWHLAEALEIEPERLKRVVFNEITKPAIEAAFTHPGQIDPHKVDAQQARRILDRIVGYQLSPLLWRKVATGLSAGRVQTVAVRLIVDREREIRDFQPEEYWKIAGVFTPQQELAEGLESRWHEFLAGSGRDQGPSLAEQYRFLGEQGAFRAELVEWDGQPFKCDGCESARKVAEALGLKVESVREEPIGEKSERMRVTVEGRLARPCRVQYVVRSIRSRLGRNRPPAPFTTASMQQAAAVRLRFSASRTMRIAQQLYEGVELPGEGGVGLITYMRTDSVNLAPQAVEQVRQFVQSTFGAKYLPQKPRSYRSGPRAQAAHEAIRPTDVSRTPESLSRMLTKDQLKLYELIWRRFVACQMAEAQWQITEISIAADVPFEGGSSKATFKAAGRQLAFDGYLKVAGISYREEQIIPVLAENTAVGPVTISPTQHFTQPPPRYTEASLVKALEAEGIGRPSTYATIIQTIQDRGYVRQIERRFHATDLGMMVTDKLVKHFPDVFDLRFTAGMEDRLDEIESARVEWVDVLRDFYGPFKADLESAAESMVHAKTETEPSDYTCPNCGKPMVYRSRPDATWPAPAIRSARPPSRWTPTARR